MNVLLALNDKYCMPTCIMLKSLTFNNPYVHIFVLYSALTDISKQKLGNAVTNNSTITFIKVESDLFNSFVDGKSYPKETCYRLIAHNYLPHDLDRILWLDGDIIVRGNISSFYNMEFGNNLFIATIDLWDTVPRKKALCIPDNKTYINAGVLLYNLKEIRKKMTLETIERFVSTTQEKTGYDFAFLDQDIVNGLFYNEILALNTPPYVFNCPVLFIGQNISKKSSKEVIILHYCAPKKPWAIKDVYYGYCFWDYVKYANMIPEYKKVFKKIIPRYFVLHTLWIVWRSFKKVAYQIKRLFII